jgi:hypothetical protein
MEDIIKGNFKITGINEVNIDKVLAKWNRLWWLAEWRNQKENIDWRIIKNVRKDASSSAIKLTISEDQVRELISKLKLTVENTGFNSGFSWRRDEDWKYLDDYCKTKYSKKVTV